MGLSEYDKKVLEQLERDLMAGDDSLARRLGSKKNSNSAAKLIAGALVAVVGLSLLVFAAITQLVVFGVVGFVVALTGVLIASANPAGRAQKSTNQKPQRGSFFENRWENRRNS